MEPEVTLLHDDYPREFHVWASNDLTIRMPTLSFHMLAKAQRLDLRDRQGVEDLGLLRPQGLSAVRSNAPVSARNAVYTCARYFRREFGYDFVQYSVNETDRHTCATTRAFLWTNSNHFGLQIWGACCFRWREPPHSDPLWALQWIWLHPYLRGRGLLQQTWPYFLRRFGWFDVEPPYSTAMRGFLLKVRWASPFVWDEQDHRDVAS